MMPGMNNDGRNISKRILPAASNLPNLYSVIPAFKNVRKMNATGCFIDKLGGISMPIFLTPVCCPMHQYARPDEGSMKVSPASSFLPSLFFLSLRITVVIMFELAFLSAECRL